MSPEDVVLLPFAVAFGAVIGSFANVCIHRLPQGASVVSPRSACPACSTPIRAADNVPILSWLLLRGRCRSCRAPISPRYPLVEALVAALFLAEVLRHGVGLVALAGAVLATAAVILAATDLETRILPDEVTLGVLAIGLLLAAVRDLQRLETWNVAAFSTHLFPAAAGAAFGAALVWGVGAAYERIRGGEGMGLGDVKMIAMIGAFVGPAGVLLTLFLASVTGTLIAGLPALARAAAWRRSFARARRSATAAREEASRHGFLVEVSGRVAETGRRFGEIPGAPAVGASLASAGPVARPVVAFVRLSRRRAAKGRTTATGRLAVEDESGAFFRVLAARAEPVPGGLLVLLARVDVPFGVFLAVAAVVVHEWGGPIVDLIAAGMPVPGRGLLP